MCHFVFWVKCSSPHSHTNSVEPLSPAVYWCPLMFTVPGFLPGTLTVNVTGCRTPAGHLIKILLVVVSEPALSPNSKMYFLPTGSFLLFLAFTLQFVLYFLIDHIVVTVRVKTLWISQAQTLSSLNHTRVRITSSS